MYSNGAVIGIVVVITHQAHQLIPPVPHPALPAWPVVVSGATVRAPVVCRIAATAALRAFATVASAFAWCVQFYRFGHSHLFLS